MNCKNHTISQGTYLTAPQRLSSFCQVFQEKALSYSCILSSYSVGTQDFSVILDTGSSDFVRFIRGLCLIL